MASNDVKYEDLLGVDEFLGINQAIGDNMKLGYARYGVNFDVSHGRLQAMGKPKMLITDASHTAAADVSSNLPITDIKDCTLAFLTQRWKEGVSGPVPADTVYAVAAVGGKLYARKCVRGLSGDLFEGCAWTELWDTGDIPFGLTSDKFDFIAYELNYSPPELLTQELYDSMNPSGWGGGWTGYYFDSAGYAYRPVIYTSGSAPTYVDGDGETKTLTIGECYVREAYEAPVDCLLLTNETDGLICVYAPLNGLTLSARKIELPDDEKFCAITRHSDRIWGACGKKNPDKLMYSAPGDVFNWEQNSASPADGAGDVQQPKWDGDLFVALRTFGTSLLAIKKHRIWRVTGATPDEYVFREQYGEGAIQEDTVASIGAYVYMVSETGLIVYDGSATRQVKHGVIQDYLSDVLAAEDTNADTRASARILGGKYVMKLPIAEDGNRVVTYDTVEGAITVMELPVTSAILAIEALEGHMYALIRNGDYACLYKLWDAGALPMTWTSARQDLGAKNILKSGFEVYLSADKAVRATVGIRTEKRLSEKTVTLTANQAKKVRINNRGRWFSLSLAIPEPSPANAWALLGGMQIHLEYDYD